MAGDWIAIGLTLAVLLLAVWQVTANIRLNRMTRRYRQLSAGVEGQPLDQLLERILDRGELEARAIAEIQQQLSALGEQVQGNLQRVGMVRYNAFDDTGGDQSFALAVLDAKGNGAILNGLFHRTECRVYAKPVQDWKSTYSMSDEELEAIRKAREPTA